MNICFDYFCDTVLYDFNCNMLVAYCWGENTWFYWLLALFLWGQFIKNIKYKISLQITRIFYVRER